ncbi:MAG: ATP synthase F1 subunit gamma [bacterium]|nr:ATP synthase F1 subunit gamma [bacterium]
MASTREILERIHSIQDTQKITNAMYMISSTKLKKAKKNLESTEPYFYTLQNMITRILRHLPLDVHSQFFHTRPDRVGKDRKRGLIVVTGDKGLAGAYNHNVLKLASEWLEEEGENSLFVIGELGRQYFLGRGIPIDTHFQYTAQDPNMSRARRITEQMIELFCTRGLDEVWIVYTQMVNGMQTEAKRYKLLPLTRAQFAKIPLDVHLEEYTMKPSPKEVLDHIIPNYMTGFVYGALVESFCSEQNARMMAMQAATDNANAMLRELSVSYNRMRQAAITQEITEVISGARAQKQKRKRKERLR